MLPQCYPNYKTVHRRFQQWCGTSHCATFYGDGQRASRQRVLDEPECYIDATFATAKGGGAEIGPTRRGKGVKIMAIVDRHGLPLSVTTHAANHHEVTLVQLCFDFYMIEAKPENLIGDRAYDSDALDRRCAKRRRDDSATPFRPKSANPGRTAPASIRATLDRRTLLRVDSMATSTPRSLGILPREISSASCSLQPIYPAQTILR